MSYDTLRKSAFSHRTIAAAAMLAVLGAVAGAGVVTANPVQRESDRYHLNYSMHKVEDGSIAIRVRVTDKQTNAVVGTPSVNVKPGERAAMNFANEVNGDRREWTITVEQNADGSGTLAMRVARNGREEQVTRLPYPAPGGQPMRNYRGQPISLDLSNADIKDVLRTFGQITGLEMTFGPGVEGSVNVHIVGMPWDEALDQILRENGLSYRLEGNKMYVFKPAP